MDAAKDRSGTKINRKTLGTINYFTGQEKIFFILKGTFFKYRVVVLLSNLSLGLESVEFAISEFGVLSGQCFYFY